MSPHTVWQPIVGMRPSGKVGFVIEVLACGHPGKRTELYRAERHITAQRTRVCGPCTAIQKARAGEQTSVAQKAICPTKRVYASALSAQSDAARWQGARLPYRCDVCQQWHLTSQH